MINDNRYAIISTETLCKSYVSDGEVNHVIKNMDLKIYDKDFTVIMGASGSGKSTLLYVLSGMLDSTSGEVTFNDQNITKMKEHSMAGFRRDTLGFVFQGINLIPDLTVLENIICPAYGSGRPMPEVVKTAEQLIEKLDLKGHEKKFPEQLSGGQRQRVAICRAMINHPKVLFADEPTGALNSTQGKHVLDIFTKLNGDGQSVVMVTHDLKAALRGNRIIYLRDGRIDGELTLPPYNESDVDEREKCVFSFLKEHGF
jgi:putative ABC transport system ATP-binding protein